MTIPRDAHLAGRIAARHATTVHDVRALTGRGSVNHVFVVTTDAGALVVRFTVDPDRPDVTTAQAWAATHAARHGVPTPRVVAADQLDAVPYLVHEFVDGAPARDSSELWRTLGRYAQRIGAIDVPPHAPATLFNRFGADLPAAWTKHVNYNLACLTADDPLLDLGVYSPTERAWLADRIRSLVHRPFGFGLAHGDLSARNVLVDRAGVAVLLDWDTVSTGPAPWTDVCAVAREHLLTGRPGRAELDAFVHACGADDPGAQETIASMLVLGALDLVRWALDRCPPRLPAVVEDARRIIAHPTY